jgi:LmbE family N-acetylglucosaminyl deacetylase
MDGSRISLTADPLDGPAIFVAPHLDDVALSCGGTVAYHASRGQQPLIVTIAAGDDGDDENARYVESRRREDTAAASILGASARWFPYLDAVYRGYGAAVFGGRRQESDLADRIGRDLEQLCEDTASASVFLPLGIGNHVDHQLCASLHERLRRSGAAIWFYEDMPYVLRWVAAENWINEVEPAPLREAIRPYLEQRLATMGLVPCVVEITRHMATRLAAVECYASQIGGLFPQNNHRAQIRGYAARLMATQDAGYGERFWTFANSAADAPIDGDDPAAGLASHSAARWARAVVKAIDAPRDPKTIAAWSRSAAAAPGTLKNWCRTAGVAPKRSLAFARVLRAILWRQKCGRRPEDLLDVVDHRTLAGLLKLGVPLDIAPRGLPDTVEEFLERQQWVVDPVAVHEVEVELQSRNLPLQAA